MKTIYLYQANHFSLPEKTLLRGVLWNITKFKMETFATENLTGVSKAGLRENRPLKYLAVKSVIGHKIHNDKDEPLGEVEDVIVDVLTGKIYFIIQPDWFPGISKKYFAVPFNLFDVDPEKKQFILYQPREILENAPAFDMNYWPETNFHEEGTYWTFV